MNSDISTRTASRSISSKNSKPSRAFAATGVALVLITGTCVALSALIPAAIWSAAAFLLYIIALLSVAKWTPRALVILSPFLVLPTSELFSGIWIEHGAMMVESMSVGHPTGAFIRLSLIYIVFLFVAASICERVLENGGLHSRVSDYAGTSRMLSSAGNYILITFTAMYALALLLGLNTGFPLITHADRFFFKRNLDSGLFNFFITNGVPFAAILSFVGLQRRFNRIAPIYMTVLIGIYVLFGEKFTQILQMILIFLLPSGIRLVEKEGRLPITNILRVAAVCISVTFVATWLVYSAGDGPTKAFEKLQSRIVEQGQVWFLVDETNGRAINFDSSALSSDMLSWIDPLQQSTGAAGEKYGLYYVMARFAPTDTLYWNEYAGGGFVFCLMPYLLLATGYLGVVLIGGTVVVIISCISAWLALAIFQGDLLLSMLLSKYLNGLYGGYIIGYLWFVFGVKAIFYVVAAVIWLFYTRSRIGRTRSRRGVDTSASKRASATLLSS